MQRIKKNLIKQCLKYKSYIIIVIIGIIVSLPFTVKGGISTHDGLAHLARSYATVKGFLDGQIPSVIASNFCGNFGYSWNLFYPPLSTYIAAIFKIFVPTFITALKLTVIFAIIMSGITMYNLIKSITKKDNTSLITAIIYMTSIYFITDIYVRMAIGEIMAYMFAPILFEGLYNLFYEDGKKHYLITLGAVGIILSHNISTLLIALVGILFILFHIEMLKSKDIWKKLIINMLFIVFIVMFFYGPFIQNITNTKYSATNGQMGSQQFAKQHALYLYQLVFGNNQYGDSLDLNSGIENEMNFSLGAPIIVALLFTPFVIKKVEKNKRKLYLVTFFIGILFALMSTNLWPWSKMPNIMTMVQFPWRMLLISTIMFSIIAGINISKIEENEETKTLLIITMIILLYTFQYISGIVKFNYDTDDSYLYEKDIIEDYRFTKNCGGLEYLPVKARKEYIVTRSDKAEVLKGNANIENEYKDGLNMTFDILNNNTDTEIELPYIYYLGYDIELNGKKIENRESENGFVSIIIPSSISNGKVTVKYSGTVLSKICVIFSSIAILGFTLYVIYYRKKVYTSNDLRKE